LHGTAKPRLFNRNDRALSHGCIRVVDPAALAGFLLAGQPGFDRAHIESAMTRAEPLLVSLSTPATVLLVYATATADEDGRLRFWPDLYGADAQLERVLSGDRSRPIPPRRAREIARRGASDPPAAQRESAGPPPGTRPDVDAQLGGASSHADPAAFDSGGGG
jgi:hypothetical protein